MKTDTMIICSIFSILATSIAVFVLAISYDIGSGGTHNQILEPIIHWTAGISIGGLVILLLIAALAGIWTDVKKTIENPPESEK